jgi:hypothetical protein
MREDFALLRERDAARAPSFERMMRSPVRAPRKHTALIVTLPIAAVAMAAAAAFALWTHPPDTTHHAVVQPAPAQDPEPLAFLLDEPFIGANVDFDGEHAP